VSAFTAYVLGVSTALLGTLAVIVPIAVKLAITECKTCKELRRVAQAKAIRDASKGILP
jgi:hypothetical protein